jgi:hypothetical protein
MEGGLEKPNRRKVLGKLGNASIKIGAAVALGALGYEGLRGLAESNRIEAEHTYVGEGQVVQKADRGTAAGSLSMNPFVTKLSPGEKARGSGYLSVKVGDDGGVGSIQVPLAVYDKYDVGDRIRVKYTTMPDGGESRLNIYKLFSIVEQLDRILRLSRLG